MLHECNAKPLFLGAVIAERMSVWFNTCNFPKTEVGSGKARAPIQTLENLEMKKTLVALAALAAASAFAQTTVSISGNADVAIGSKEAITGTGTQFLKSSGVSDGGMFPNRIFIRVSEDLGGGMKFNFVNEHGFSPTSTSDWSFRTVNAAPSLLVRLHLPHHLITSFQALEQLTRELTVALTLASKVHSVSSVRATW